MQAKRDIFSTIIGEGRRWSGWLTSVGKDEEEREVLSSLLQQVDRYCAEHIDPAAVDKGGPLNREIREAVAERGWFGLTIPEAYGGAGLSLSAATQVVSRLARYSGSLATAVGLHSGLALYGLIHLGSEQLKQRYLPEIASGERIASFAATEPSAGSDLAGIKTTLSERDGKLRLDGTKIYVTNGGFAGVMTVLARSPGLGGAKHGHTLLVVDPTWPGVERQGEENKLGLKASSTISVYFDGVEIPRDHVLGELSQGMDYAYRALTWGRTFMASGCLGTAQAGYAEALEHTSQRVQFGKPLDQFPLVRNQLATMAAEIYAIESVLQLTCARHDDQASDIVLDSTVAKILASEGAWRVVDRGLQLMGGTGYMEDAGMARRLRDLRVTRIFEGANDVLRLHMATATLGWAKSSLQDIPSLEPMVSEEARPLARRFDALAVQVGKALAEAKKKHGFRLIQRQCVQSSIADVVIATYAMLATTLRLSGQTQHASGDGQRLVALANTAGAYLETMAHRSLAELGGDVPPYESEWIDQILQM